MTRKLLLWIVARELKRMTFPHQDGGESAAESEGILDIFHSGARASVEGLPLGEVNALEAQIPWSRRFFFWEGFAMGLAGLGAFNLPHTNPETLKLIPHFRSMHYTGYGVWNGLVPRWMPFMTLREDHAFWEGALDYERLHPLMTGGRSFAELVNKGGMAHHTLKRAKKTGEAALVMGAEHGCGRALWWLYMNNPEGLTKVLDEHPEHARGIAEGVGLAIAFVNIQTPERIAHWIDAFREDFRPSLIMGVGVCLQAIIQEDPAFEREIEAIEVPVLKGALAKARGALQATPVGMDWYYRCALYLRSSLEKAPL